MPSIKENAKIVAAAKADPDAQPLTASQLKAMVPLKSIRGRPKSVNKKTLVLVRYSPEVVAYFRCRGEGPPLTKTLGLAVRTQSAADAHDRPVCGNLPPSLRPIRFPP